MTYEEFVKLKWEADQRGQKEYRPNGGPFQGDPTKEKADEFIDAGTYNDYELQQGLITEEEHEWFERKVFELWQATQTVLSRRKTVDLLRPYYRVGCSGGENFLDDV